MEDKQVVSVVITSIPIRKSALKPDTPGPTNSITMDILDDCEKKAKVSLDGAVDFTLKDKVRDGRLYVDQGIIAGMPS